MSPIDPRYIGAQEALRREALAREIAEARRDWEELKREIRAQQFDSNGTGSRAIAGDSASARSPHVCSPPVI